MISYYILVFLIFDLGWRCKENLDARHYLSFSYNANPKSGVPVSLFSSPSTSKNSYSLALEELTRCGTEGRYSHNLQSDQHINMRASQRYFQAAEDFRWRSLSFERIVQNIECFLP